MLQLELRGLNPDAATAAYMATLSPEAHATATAYTHGGHWLLLWSWVVTVVAALIVFRTDLFPSIRNRIERSGRAHPNRVAFLSAVAFLVALMRRAPRTWWVWSGVVATIAILFVVVISPVVIEPLFNTYSPAPSGSVRDAVVELAKSSGIPPDKIYVYNGSKQSERYTANVAGLLGTARIALSDTMFKTGTDLSEIKAVLGHEMVHYAHWHTVWYAGALGGLASFAFFLCSRLFIPTAAVMSAQPKTLGIADPVGLPALMVILATVQLVCVPVTNTLIQYEESDADAFSLRQAHQPDGLARALVKTITYRASSPSRLEEILFYDHPSVERRAHHAIVWKFQHPELVGK